MFFYLLLFRIKSLREFNFEPESSSEVDHEIEHLLDQNLFPLRSASWVPYFKLAIDEFKNSFEIYREWLIRVCQVHGQKKLYGPFDQFPYPELRIHIRIDKGEEEAEFYST